MMVLFVWAGLLVPKAWAQTNNGGAPLLSVNELSLENGASSKLQLLLPGPVERAQTFVLSTTVGQVVQVPQRVTLNQGATSVELPVQAVGVGKTVLRVGGATRVLSASITVIDGTPRLVLLEPSPGGATRGAALSLQVGLNAVPRDSVRVALRAPGVSESVLQLPSEVLFAPGQQRAAVPLTTLEAGVYQVQAELGSDVLEAWIRSTEAAARPVSLLPDRSLVEQGAKAKLQLRLSGFSQQAQDLILKAEPAHVLQVATMVRVPAGVDRVDVPFTALKSGQATVTVSGGGRSLSAQVLVRDALPATTAPAVTLAPPSLVLAPGASGQVVVSLDAVRSYDLLLNLSVLSQQSASSGGTSPVVQIPPTLYVPAGERQAVFQVQALSAGQAKLALKGYGNAQVATLDVQVRNDVPLITGLLPVQQNLPKGSIGQAQVKIAPGTSQPSDVAVRVDALNVVGVPDAVTVAPGQTSAQVPVTALNEGVAQLTVGLNGSQASAQLRVTPAEVEELRPPAVFELGLGNTTAYPLKALMTDGNVVDRVDGLLLRSEDERIFKVNSQGQLEGVAIGEAWLELKLAGFTVRAKVRVKQWPALQLTPAQAEVGVGSTQPFLLSSAAPAPVGGLWVTLSYSGQGAADLPNSLFLSEGSSSQSFALKALSEGSITVLAEAPDRQSARAQVLMRQSQLSISSVDPQRGNMGTVVTIRGLGFDPVAANNQVWIGSAQVELVSASPTELKIRIPATASTGVIKVSTPLGSVNGPVFTVEQAQDAGLSATPNMLRLLRGSESTSVIGIVSTGTQSFSGAMSLSISGLPEGVTASFDPKLLPADRTATLRLQASANVKPGSYALVVRGSGNASAGPITRTVALTLNVPDPVATPSTGVRGRFVTPEGQPIAGVIVRADTGAQNSPVTATDASGGFELAGLSEGPLTLRFDATPANPLYPIWPFSVQIKANQMVVIKDFVISPPPVVENFNTINNAVTEQRIRDDRFPGLEIVLPAGAEIIGWDGVKKTRIAVEKREISELPVVTPPVPTGAAYQLYFGTPMGGIPSKPIPITLPNDTGAEPGETINVWFFDGSPMGGTGEWKIAGQAVVSADGKTARMVSGGLTRFCGVCGLACLERPPKPPPPPPDCPKPSGGNPVDLLTGQELTRTGGMSCKGHTPVETGRNYNPIDAFGNIGGTEGSIGYGWALDHDAMLLAGNTVRLVMPGNVHHVFASEADGSLRNRTEPAFDGARMAQIDGLWRLLFKDGTRWTFQSYAGAPGNVRGQPQFLVETLSPNGAKVTVARNSRGQLLSVGTELRRITASYGSSGFIESLSDPEGRAERFSYTASKRLATVTDADGRETRYSYVKDADMPVDSACRHVLPPETGERIKTINYPGLANPTENFYGSSRRVLRQTTAQGKEFRFSYRVSGACITRVNNPGQVCSGAACPTEDSWENYEAGWRFHGGQVLATTTREPDGTTRLARFGSQGQVLEMSDSAGGRTQWTRDAQNRRTKVVDAIGRTSRMVYDDLGNVVRQIDALGRITDIQYDPLWNKPSSVSRYADDGTAQTWRMAYDNKGNLNRLTDPLGHQTQMDYNANGQLTAMTDALSQTSSMGYNAAGDLVRLADALGNTTRISTDRAGRPLSSTDPLSYTSSSTSNGIGQTTEIEDPLGGKTLMSYDAGARLKKVTNPLGKDIASYSYDEFGRLASRSDALGAQERYSYDAADRVSEVLDRKGQATRYSYDEAGRVTRMEAADRTVESSYDGAGRLTRFEQSGLAGASRVDYEYDAADRLIREIQTSLGRSQTVSYAYDRLDRRISRKLDEQDEVRYDWDLANRLTAIHYAGQSTRYAWDKAGRLTKKTLPNGITADYSYDAANRLLGIDYKKADGSRIEQISYSYDARGQRTSKTLLNASTRTETPMTAEYDAADRMSSIKLRPGKPDEQVCTLSYDANGNLSEKSCTGAGAGVTRYSWDSLNKLIGISGPGLEAAFSYDVLGRRVSRTLNGEQTQYAYDGEQAIAESSSGVTTNLLTGLAIDELIASFKQGNQRVMLSDALGSVLAETRLDGSIATHSVYSAYGETGGSGEAPSTSTAYTGREHDAGSLYYYRARFYDPQLKRFLAEDPSGLAGGRNLQMYVRGQPAELTDPSGEIPILPIAYAYARCVASCMARSAAHDLITGDIDCFDVGDAAKDCAIDCLNPFSWLKKKSPVLNANRPGTKKPSYWRKEYEKREGKPWPKTDDGKNYHAHHKDPLADGGKDVYENVVPMHPDDHFKHHENDRRRWGKRGK